MTKKHVAVAVLVVLACTTLTGGVYAFMQFHKPPMPMPESTEDIFALVTSERFAQMTESQRSPYMAKIAALIQDMPMVERLKLLARVQAKVKDRPELQKAMQTMPLEFMQANARRYEIADAATRQQMLDDDIDKMELARKLQNAASAVGLGAKKNDSSPAAAPKPQASSQSPPKRNDMNDFRNQMLRSVQYGNPQQQSYVAEYFQALRARRVERGLPPDPSFGSPRRGR